MMSKNLWVFVVSALVLVLSVQFTSAAITNDLRVTVNGIEAFPTQTGTAGVFAGETIPVRVIFTASENAKDIRIFARLIGESGASEVTERFDVIQGSQYSKLLNIRVPFDIDPSERFVLEITVESNSASSTPARIQLEVQRDSYLVEILSVIMPEQIKVGSTVALDAVLKNRGRQTAEDTYLRVSIPELGASTSVYFGDLSPEDRSDPDKEDAVERRVYLNVPRTAKPGVYTVHLEAYNTDSSTVSTKRVAVTASEGSRIVSPVTNKRMAVGEETTYSLTIVNADNQIRVYDLAIDAPQKLMVESDDSVFVVPAGSSKTIMLKTTASEEGTYIFKVDVNSDGELIQQESFGATVEGSSATPDATVVLTVVLAVIFVVLVIVLLVLLTRKPEKKEEFGESYY